MFYDFDNQRVIFTENYWNYEYVYKNLFDITDRIIFDHERERIETSFNDNKSKVEDLVSSSMKNVTGMSGCWSVDILMDDNGEFWLIDMAIAERSAYWGNRPDSYK